MSAQAFQIAIHQDDDLHQRLDRTRWVDDLGDSSWKYGVSRPATAAQEEAPEWDRSGRGNG